MSVNRIAALLVLSLVLAVTPALAEEGAPEERTVDIAKFTCKELMGGDDTDREVGMAFFHGFLAGKRDSRTINLQDMGAMTDRVKDYCLSNPTSTVMDAFAKSAM